MPLRIYRRAGHNFDILRATALRISSTPTITTLSRATHQKASSNGEGSSPSVPSLWARLNFKRKKFEERYKDWKKDNSATDELMQFALKNFVYVGLTAGVAYLFKEHIEAVKKVDRIKLAVESQTADNAVRLEKMCIFGAQPFLYLTRHLTEIDKQEYDKNQAELIQGINQQQRYLQEFSLVPYIPAKGLEKYLQKLKFLLTHPIGYLIYPTERIMELRVRLEQEIEQLKVVQAFNEIIWLQKNRQYKVALTKIEGVIQKLEAYQKNLTQKTLFNLPTILAAAYNAQAKLQASLAFTKKPEEVKLLRDDSLAAYNKAIAVLEKVPDRWADLAILKSSKGFLLADCDRPEEALTLHQEADILKPNDGHILCGIGEALYSIEKTQLLPRKTQLDLAYGYLTRALQLSETANKYVSRGKVLLELNETDGAMADFESALKLDKHHIEANLQKSYLLLSQPKPACTAAGTYFKRSLVPLIGRSFEIERRKATFAKKLPLSCHPLMEDLFLGAEDVIGEKTSIPKQLK